MKNQTQKTNQPPYHFDGETYRPDLDGARLTTQLERVLCIMQDNCWHTLAEIAERVSYPPYDRSSEAGVSARLRDLRKARFGGYIVQRRRAQESGLFEYRLFRQEPAQTAINFVEKTAA